MEGNRKLIIQAFFMLFALLYAGKLLYLQLLDDTYEGAARSNAILRVIQYPYRGEIYDRTGRLLVSNEPVYDIVVVPREVKKMDTAAFCVITGITQEDFKSKLLEAKTYSRVKPSPFIQQLNNQDFARLNEVLVDFPGFSLTPRTVRSYPQASMANALGYIGEISKTKLEKLGTANYRKGDFIGISGIESYYEEILRGKRGVELTLVDVHGVKKGRYKEGAYDTASVKGENLYTGIDLKLQQYGESLMVNKAGSVVAIDPSTGQILSFISGPSYDPNLLKGREFPKNYMALQRDTMKPLFNRPTMAMYPPGSIFKLIQSLVGQQEGVIDSNTSFPCVKNVVNCHNHPSPSRLKQAIQYSCNPYFLGIYRRIINQDESPNTFIDTHIGYEKWREYLLTFGVGQALAIDLPNVKKGILPSTKYFDKVYGAYHWKFSNIYSLSIGQGELGIVPLQMANIAAIIANRGWYYMPHFVKSVGENGLIPKQFTEKHYTKVESKYFNVVTEGMLLAVNQGTVSGKARLKGVEICGKTGTAQNPHGEDHSVFICFAPKENPKIAMAVFVENAGFGGKVAAPIATLMIEKYLNDTITRKDLEKKVMEMNFTKVRQNGYHFQKR